MFRIKFWGVRGSIPTPGPHTARFGGNTSCLEVNADDTLVILDGGTGLRLLGEELIKKRKGAPIRTYMFFSHVHWDHIQGFPFFIPIFQAQNEIHIFGGQNLEMTLGETLAGQMNFPNFPVTLEACAAKMHFKIFEDGQALSIADGLTITGLPLKHPNGCYGYRIEYEGKVFTYCTDTEHDATSGEPDKNILKLAKNADLFVYDSQYTPAEYTGEEGGMPKVGWGHSTYVEAATLAKLANVKQLVLFHHDPGHDDAKIEEMETAAKALFPNCEAACEGREFLL
ncbi:MAG: MBL fold metallo-hydrolase [Deltaproteobacteria bacterium]|nr:MBL fold metallo-hydrolase [Deltaproteobacteria bacterium]MBN2671024.1 MBL fold metallo-hydrolase [Deltaproteobacteria bacterium]